MRRAHLAALLLLAPVFGCWEQMDGGKWFPQMKRQLAVQAYEEVLHDDQMQGFMPPEGTVPVGWANIPDLASMAPAQQDAVPNPVEPTLASLTRGKQLFEQTCAACHGVKGGGDGPVAGPPFGTGPFGLVLPIGGPTSVAKGLTDGHIYATISLGRGRMPSYRRLSPEDRWNLVNYVRELNDQLARGGRS